MSIPTTDAVILNQIEYSNTSLIVTLFTEKFGLLSGLAKGARRQKSPFLGSFDRLNHNEITFYRHTRSTLHTISESKIKNSFLGLRESQDRMYAAHYIADIVRGMTREEEPHPELFNLLVNTLRELEQADDVPRVLFQFEIKFLSEVGFRPELESCVICWQKPQGQRIYFCANEGGIACELCAAQMPAQVTLTSKGALASLIALQKRRLSEGRTVRLSPLVISDIKRLIRPYVVAKMEREPKTMKFV
ncbi:MAG: DNA repair protein RecO [Planctomycetota bacterium]|nr:DNA repair protein RecO [Planctomycetota bacterium]MDA1140881.1 DNA repair protein RecO [Planctomycetota bacterium]